MSIESYDRFFGIIILRTLSLSKGTKDLAGLILKGFDYSGIKQNDLTPKLDTVILSEAKDPSFYKGL